MNEFRLNLRVIPKASTDAIVGWHGDALKIKVRAAPEAGKANAAVIEVLARALDIAPRAVVLESGATSRNKRVRIVGLTEAMVRARLAPAKIN